jgi:hypothetical protein
MFQWILLPASQKREAAGSSETLVTIYQSTGGTPQKHNINIHIIKSNLIHRLKRTSRTSSLNVIPC